MLSLPTAQCVTLEGCDNKETNLETMSNLLNMFKDANRQNKSKTKRHLIPFHPPHVLPCQSAMFTQKGFLIINVFQPFPVHWSLSWMIVYLRRVFLLINSSDCKKRNNFRAADFSIAQLQINSLLQNCFIRNTVLENTNIVFSLIYYVSYVMKAFL